MQLKWPRWPGRCKWKMWLKGYLGIEYSLEKLKAMCPRKCYTVSEINSNEQIKAEINRRRGYYSAIYNSDIPTLVDEKWVEIEGWEKYSASNYGRIKLTNTNEILKQYDEIGRYGYLKLDLDKDGVTHSEYVYTIIAWAFLGKGKIENNGKHVHHIDNNGYNCRPENLILVDSKQHSFIHGFDCESKKDVL